MTPGTGDLASRGEADELSLLNLIRKPEISWITKARACRQLQQQGLSAEVIDRETTLNTRDQSIIIKSIEVYESLEQGRAPKPVRDHFALSNYDVLYEFHALNQTQRVHAATLALAKHLNASEAHTVAEAIAAFAHFNHPPKGFTDHSGDAVACQCWLSARQEQDVILREQLIARGLRFAHSAAARLQLTSLLDHSPSDMNQPTP